MIKVPHNVNREDVCDALAANRDRRRDIKTPSEYYLVVRNLTELINDFRRDPFTADAVRVLVAAGLLKDIVKEGPGRPIRAWTLMAEPIAVCTVAARRLGGEENAGLGKADGPTVRFVLWALQKILPNEKLPSPATIHKALRKRVDFSEEMLTSVVIKPQSGQRIIDFYGRNTFRLGAARPAPQRF